jgi:molybdopterin converting factor small subunit
MSRMSAKVKLSDPLSVRAGASQVDASGSTLGELLDDLDRQFPGMKEDIYSPSKMAVRDHISIFKNDNLIRRLDERLVDGDLITILMGRKGG